MTRQDLPRREAPTVARHRDTIPHPVPLWGDPPPPPTEQPCWRCRRPTERRDHRGVLPECEGCRFLDDARPDDKPTSRAAASSVPRGPRSQLAQRILTHLRECGDDGSTDDEIAVRWPDEHTGSISRRRDDLVRAGLAEDSGRTRPTRRGREAIVWVVVRP